MRFNRRMNVNTDTRSDLPVQQRRQIYTYPPQLSQSKDIRTQNVGSEIAVKNTAVTSCINADSSFENTFSKYEDVYDAKDFITDSYESYEEEDLKEFPHNIVVGSAACDGIGLSTTLSMLAKYLADQDLSVALIDADMDNGGIDVLLGLESDEGRRLQEVEAPLGRCDGNVLKHEILHWDGVDVLAYAPWHGDAPKPWVVEAAIRALADVCDVVIIDIGSGAAARKLLENTPMLSLVPTIFATELSVLSLARLRMHLKRLSEENELFSDEANLTVIGLDPRGLSSRAAVLNTNEAAEYLETSVSGRVVHNSKLYADIIGGYGIKCIPKSSEEAMKQLYEWLFGDQKANTSRRYRRHATKSKGNHANKRF